MGFINTDIINAVQGLDNTLDKNNSVF